MSERISKRPVSAQFNKNQPPPIHGPGPGRGPMGMSMSGEKARNFKATMKNLLHYLRPFRVQITVALILAIISTSFGILGPKILGNATTRLFEGAVAKIMHTPGASIDFTYIGNIILLLIVLYIISAGTGYFQGLIMANISAKFTYDLRKRIAEKINRLPFNYFDKTSYGNVLSRVTNDVDTVYNSLSQSMSQMVSSIVMIAGILIMMFTISWAMTLVALVVLPLSVIFITFFVKKSQLYFKQHQNYLGEINGHVEEMYSGHNVMRAFNGEEKSIAKFDEINTRLYSVAWKSQFFAGMMMPVTQFIGNLGYVAICILGGYLAIVKTITVGDILAFIQYVRQFNQPVAQAANMAGIMQSFAAAAERVFEFLGEEEETPDPIQPIQTGDVQGQVTFNNIDFGYNPDKIIIKDFTVDIKSGQRVAIVGPTGAGKTTLVKLLMRFYDVNSGAIKVDGIDIRQMRRNDLRSIFGMVLQDTWLFNGTIKENIRYGNSNATDEEVIAAAKMAYVDHFVHTLPHNYEMILNEEASNISQGQKQLLTIARAVLANPKILILDEATSSVDTRTEILIQKAMEKLMKNRTSFIIAHRLSTIRNADIILVIRDGAIVEQGNHNTLIAANGFYSSLYRSQFETGLVS
jgi:ATP-binding cassette, subfamily B, multidrug efflux pump